MFPHILISLKYSKNFLFLPFQNPLTLSLIAPCNIDLQRYANGKFSVLCTVLILVFAGNSQEKGGGSHQSVAGVLWLTGQLPNQYLVSSFSTCELLHHSK